MNHNELYIRELTIPASKDIGYIYKITSPTGKVYVGQTRRLNRRIIEHKSYNRESNSIVHKSINKYGWDNHKFEILDEVSVSKLDNAEQFYISICNSFVGINPNGMNLTIGGGGTIGTPFTMEHKMKISKANKGRTMSDYTRSRLMAANKGRKQSPEEIAKRAKSMTGRVVSEEVKDRIRKKMTGQKRTDEQKEKMSKAHIGKHNSESSKEKNRISSTGRKHSDDIKKKMSDNARLFWNSDDGRKKRSDISKKLWGSDEYRNKIITGNKNKKVSDETKEKIRQARKNQVFSDETRAKLSIIMKKRNADIKLKKQIQCTETI
jgi:group I intron endonuclease